MISAATTTLNMVRFELLRAQKQLQNPRLPEAHRECLDALWKVYRLSRPHTRRDDNKMPFGEVPEPLLNSSHWQQGIRLAAPAVEAALHLQQQMQAGNLGWHMWNQLADRMLEAMNAL